MRLRDANLYLKLIDTTWPRFSRGNAFFFSLHTVTTVGCSNVYPRDRDQRSGGI